MQKKLFHKFSPKTETNPEAIYTSRFMSFTNLSKPINSTGVKIEDLEGNDINLIVFNHILIQVFSFPVPDSQLIDLHVSDNFQNLLDQGIYLLFIINFYLHINLNVYINLSLLSQLYQLNHTLEL